MHCCVAFGWIERRIWPTFTWITVAFPVKNSASWLMLPTSGELFIIVLILDNGKTHCPSFSVCFSAIFNEKYKKPHNFRTLHFKIKLFISETVTLYKFLFFYHMVTEKSNILTMQCLTWSTNFGFACTYKLSRTDLGLERGGGG